MAIFTGKILKVYVINIDQKKKTKQNKNEKFVIQQQGTIFKNCTYACLRLDEWILFTVFTMFIEPRYFAMIFDA